MLWSGNDHSHECKECGTLFKRHNNLISHINVVHKQQYPYWCELCGKGTSTKEGLRGHLSNKHGLQKDFKCPICKCEFAYKRQLQNHMLQKHWWFIKFGDSMITLFCSWLVLFVFEIRVSTRMKISLPHPLPFPSCTWVDIQSSV